MDTKTANKVLALANEASIDADLYDNDFDNYSGRGMYGKTTTAIVCDSFHEAQELDKALSIEQYRERYSYMSDIANGDDDYVMNLMIDEEEYEEGNISNFRCDSLGLSQLIY
jgi:hypothetical protein